MTRVNNRQRGGKIAPVQRLHNSGRPLPTVASKQATRGFERSKMALRVETITALAPLNGRQHTHSFIIAYLLNADPRRSGKVNGTQRVAKCHVESSCSLLRLFSETFFLYHMK